MNELLGSHCKSLTEDRSGLTVLYCLTLTPHEHQDQKDSQQRKGDTDPGKQSNGVVRVRTTLSCAYDSEFCEHYRVYLVEADLSTDYFVLCPLEL